MALRRSPPASWRMSSSTWHRGQQKPPYVNILRVTTSRLDGWPVRAVCGVRRAVLVLTPGS